ncbi:MAG: hypothetical protein ACRD3E_19365, partial [Terriglobales bacterium]
MSRVEIVAARETGSEALVAYVMSDSGPPSSDNPAPHSPAHILDVLYFSPTQTAARASAVSTFHPTLVAGEAYCVV